MKVLFEPITFTDIFLAIELCPIEISGLAKVKKDGEIYTFHSEPIIFKQAGSITRTEFDPHAHHTWLQEMLRAKKYEEILAGRLWWHSHVWSETRFSERDRKTIKEVFGGNLDEWWFAFVGNKWGDFNLVLNVYRPNKKLFIPVKEIGFTEKISEEKIRALMIERKDKINRIIAEQVSVISETNPFERILAGIFRSDEHQKEDFADE